MASWLSEILATRPKAYPPQKHISPHLLPKLNMLRFTACRDESRKDLTLLCTPNMHTNSLVSHVQSPVAFSSSVTSFSTPVDKAGCAKIHKMYVRNGLSVGLEILHGSQSTMASQLSQILATWLKALSSSIASFSTPVDKAKCARINAIQEPNQKRFSLVMHTQYAYQLHSQLC